MTGKVIITCAIAGSIQTLTMVPHLPQINEQCDALGDNLESFLTDVQASR